MKAQDRFLKFVRWEEADNLYVSYCLDLFPRGEVCHGTTEEEWYHALCALVYEEAEELLQTGKALPPGQHAPLARGGPRLGFPMCAMN